MSTKITVLNEGPNLVTVVPVDSNNQPTGAAVLVSVGTFKEFTAAPRLIVIEQTGP